MRSSLYFYLLFIHLFNQIFIMPHATHGQGSLCLRGLLSSPHPWVMLKSCGLRKGVARRQGLGVLQNKEARQTRSALHLQTNARGQIWMTLCAACVVQRMKRSYTKTFSLTQWWMMSTLTTCDTRVCLTERNHIQAAVKIILRRHLRNLHKCSYWQSYKENVLLWTVVQWQPYVKGIVHH